MGKGREAYLADTMDGALLRAAGERILIKIATVAEKLPDDFKAQHRDIDWVRIKPDAKLSGAITTTRSTTTSCGSHRGARPALVAALSL